MGGWRRWAEREAREDGRKGGGGESLFPQLSRPDGKKNNMANPKPAPRKRAGEETSDALLAACTSYIAIPTMIGPYGPRVDKILLCRHEKFLQQLQGVQSNLAFTKLGVKAVLTELATCLRLKWHKGCGFSVG